MNGNKARLSAIEAVRGYEAPASIFTPRRGARGDLRRERVHQGGHAEAPAQAGVQIADGDHRALQAARPHRGRRGRRRHEGLGHGEGRHPLRPRLLPAHAPHRREARQLLRARRRRQRHRRVPGQDPDPGRARRLQLPQRRPPGHLRGPRLHRLGRHQPRLHPGEPQRQHAVHPHGVRLDDRRGARQQDAAAALPAGHGRPGRPGPAALRAREPRCRGLLRRRRAGVLPDRPELLLRPARTCSTRAAPCSGPSRPRARSSTTTTSAPSPSGCWRS